ncbi:hypothetical protein [Nocardia wallacei]|uniref:hypothetical protein n=1 Tax=Nocardia wallacei TaxID=480035 RepID=UPI002457FC0C|nr:hypothetical protein [Nocardia wallacei]
MTEMFSSWEHVFDPPLWRMEDPPKKIAIDLGLAIPTTAPFGFGKDKVPMRIKAGGLKLTGQVPGLLHAWARCTDGSWLGMAEFVIPIGTATAGLPVLQLCCGKALSPAP